MRASIEGLGERLRTDAVDVAWQMWSELGASSWDRRPIGVGIELEPLIIFTAALGPADRRLSEQAVDWCAANPDLVSLHQMRRLLQAHGWAITPAVADFGATAGMFMKRKWPGTGDGQAFMRAVPGKARAPDLHKPSLIGLRFRAVFGVGARTEILRHLLFTQRPFTTGEIAAVIPYGARQISKDLDLLTMAGMTRSRRWKGTAAQFELVDPHALTRIVGEPRVDWVPLDAVFRVVAEFIEAGHAIDAQRISNPDAEIARRWRSMEPAVARLALDDRWPLPPRRTAEGTAEWLARVLGDLGGT